jgi:hypothetical protein
LLALPSAAKKIAAKALAEAVYDLRDAAGVIDSADLKTAVIDALTAEEVVLTGPQQVALLADPTFAALSAGCEKSNPWFDPAGGLPLGGYVYEQSYTWAGWCRYEVAARARKVSGYQFRHPGEWFAEAYSAYYCPGGALGDTLAQSDPATKTWFDKKVNKMKSSR